MSFKLYRLLVLGLGFYKFGRVICGLGRADVLFYFYFCVSRFF